MDCPEPVVETQMCEYRTVDAAEFFPAPDSIVYATAFNYGEHAKEVGEKAGHPFLFSKGESRKFEKAFSSTIQPPKKQELKVALQKFGFSALYTKEGFSKLFDYEVELGLLLLKELQTVHDLKKPGAVAFVLANDWTQREFQILGEGSDQKSELWSQAKGFKNLLSLSKKAYVPREDYDWTRWPEWTIELRVNEEIRQSAKSSEMIFSPKDLIQESLKLSSGTLPKGTLVLSGTPDGIAFQVPAWKRRLAEWLSLPSSWRLSLSLKNLKDSLLFLKTGDRVEHRLNGNSLYEVQVRED